MKPLHVSRAAHVRWAALLALALATLVARGRLWKPRAPPARPDVAAPAEGQVPAVALLFGERLDLNRATAEDFRALPGVGAIRAARIVALRTARGGRFHAVDELGEVPGVGKVTLRRLRPLVTVDREVQQNKAVGALGSLIEAPQTFEE